MKNGFFLKYLFSAIIFLWSFEGLIAQPTFQPGQDPKPSGKKWEKIDVMSDEFMGSSLNTTKWDDQDPQWEGRKPARFEKSAVSVGGGNLKIVASKKSNPFNGWTHNGGLVRSRTRVTYGYFETRMKANMTALSSTFWLINKRNDSPNSSCDYRTTELDITENVGIDAYPEQNRNWVDRITQTINSNTHSRGAPNAGRCGTNIGQNGDQSQIGELASANYHVYGVWWKNARELIFFLDGTEVHRITPPEDFDLGMYLRMVVESYDWNKPRDGFDNMNASLNNRTTFYDWTRSWRLADDNTPVVQGPFGGTPRNIPGTIEAEDYDIGGQGVAYNDNDAGNNGPNVARENESVDIEARDGGQSVGWTANGEWLEYTVNAASGTYDLQARIATTSTGKSIVAKLDGTTLGTFNLPNTNGWGNFQTITIPDVSVSGGNGKVLRLEFVGGGVNLNWVKFNSTGQGGGNCALPYSNAGIVVEAQTRNFTTGAIDISCASSVDISLRASGVGAMENADFLNIYYKLNGGSQVPILENVNTYTQQTLTVDNLRGNTLEIIINAFTSFAGEVYTVDNITVTGVVANTPTNLIQNPGLETGNLNGWNGFGTRQVVSDAASGSNAVRITGVAGHSQNVTVQPNTTYTLSVKAKVQSGTVILGVKEYGGAEKGSNINSTTYTNASVTFTTGSTNTSAQIYLYAGTAGNIAFGDDFSLVASSSARNGDITGQFDKIVNSTSIYPNPVNDGYITLDLSGKSDLSRVNIFDIRGRLVHDMTLKPEKVQIDSNILPTKGVYIFSIQSGLDHQTVRLIKK